MRVAKFRGLKQVGLVRVAVKLKAIVVALQDMLPNR